jgi:tRNA(Ile)-lysidine synthase
MGGRLDPAVAAVRCAVRESCADLEPGSAVLVACSGGADSMALAAAAVFEGKAAGWIVGSVTVDHGQQVGSDQTAAAVARRLAALGCASADVVAVSVGRSGGPEGAARDARYDALEAYASELDATVLLGHTLDDQAESVLLGLARGSGTRSLAGMPPSRGRYRRPLLTLTRQVTQDACTSLGLEVWDDPHNSESRFTRVRVRQEVLPMLEQELGPGIAEALARTAGLARDDADALDAMAGDLRATADAGKGDLDVGVVAGAFPSLRRRVLRLAAIQAGCPAGDLTAYHLGELDALIVGWHGQGPITLPGQVSAVRSRSAGAGPDRLHFTR